MSRKYKFQNPEGLYFVSFATVYWIDVFVRPLYNDIMVNSLKYSQSHLGLEIYCWCIMPSHVHLIFKAKENNPDKVLGRIKEHTAKALVKAIREKKQESRKQWMLWQHHNKPVELWSTAVIEQKADYIHDNAVASGFVSES